MLNKEEIESIKEITKLQEDEMENVVNAEMPTVLKKVAGGLTLKEMKYFKDKKIFNLKEKEVEKEVIKKVIAEDGEIEEKIENVVERLSLSNDELIFDVVVPLLELRGVVESDLEDVVGSDYLTYYRRVEALTNNPKLQVKVEKKN